MCHRSVHIKKKHILSYDTNGYHNASSKKPVLHDFTPRLHSNTLLCKIHVYGANNMISISSSLIPWNRIANIETEKQII